MTENKFKEFQINLTLAIGMMLLMEEDKYIDNGTPFTDEIGKEYIKRVTKKVKENRQFVRSINTYMKIIATIARDTFGEE